MNDNDNAFVVIHGNLPHTDKTLPEYIANIVYGQPEIRVTQVGLSKFVAVCEYPQDEYRFAARNTTDRMFSFSFGASLFASYDAALRDAAGWMLQYGEHKTPA